MSASTHLAGADGIATELLAPLRLTARLFARHWPELVLIAALGAIARDVLLYLAVEAGLRNALAGMVVLSFVVLAKLVAIVLMLQALEPDLPGVRALGSSRPGDAPADDAGKDRNLSVSVVAAALLPFFAYYAAWGFLGDTVREYSRAALGKIPLGEGAKFMNLLTSQWFIASILLCWAVRFAARRLNTARPAAFLPFLIVACDATWIFIGLYALSVWQEELLRWIGSGDFLRALPQLDGLQAQLSMSAWAAEGFTPRELQPAALFDQAQRLFFYALLPLVWFVMVAIIYGYDIAARRTPERAAAEGGPGWRSHWRGWLADFLDHFVAGYRSRYLPVFRSVRMALAAGLPTLCVLILGYRLIGYAGAWVWMGATRLIGERDLGDWQLIAEPIALLFGSLSDQNGGVLLDPLRMCLLAAVFERAVAAHRSRSEI